MYQASIRGKKKHQKFYNVKTDNYTIDADHQEYAYVKKHLGNYHVSVVSNTGVDSIGIIRGSLRKFSTRIVIEVGDVVVVSKRDYQVGKVDIVHKYNPDQVQNLISEGKLSNIIIHHYTRVNNHIEEGKDDSVEPQNNYIDFGFMSDESE